ncbi:MAG: 7TM-DISM domain-containing protein, partial [Ketobacteraceae bacterium]|nr:7TM-DISM domain-containing protein [Ketobacteraceae bacterium]
MVLLLGVLYSAFAGAVEGTVISLSDPARVYEPGSVVEFWKEEQRVGSAAEVYLGQKPIDWRQSRHGVVNIGYSDKPYWFRFQLQNTTDHEEWYLLIDLPLTRSLDVYQLRGGHLENFYHLGDRFEFNARPVDHRSFVIPLTLAGNEQHTMYVRIDNAYSLQFPVYIVEKNRFLKQEITTHLLHGAFFGFLVIMMFYNGFLFFSTRDLSYLYYVCFTLSIGLFQFSQHGFGYQYLWPSEIWFQHRAAPVFCSSAFVFGALFVQSFLNTRLVAPGYHRYINGF